MTTTYHSGSLHNAHHLPLRLTPQCPPPTTQAHSTVDTQHLSLRPNPSPPPVTQDIQHLSLRPNPSPPPVTQAHPTMPSTLHSAISILAYLHLVRLTGRLSLVLEKDPAQMSCHLLKYVSTVLSSLWGIMFCGWGHYVSHCVMRMWRGCPPCHLAVSQG